MILDYRYIGPLEEEYLHGRCLVDGVEILMCFYVSTDSGFVRTYDVAGDGKAHASAEAPDVFPEGIPNGIEAPDGGAMVKTVYGKVEMFRKGE